MKRVLLVIDAQNVYFTGKLPVTYPAGSLENILLAIDKAREVNIPVAVIQHSASSLASFKKGSEDWKLHPEVEKRKYDVLFEKNMPGSFTGTGLEAWLRSKGIDTVVISGYMTQMCCDTTARQAYHLGFSVEFLSDATATLAVSNNAGSVTAEELHRASLVTQAMRFSRVLKTEEWIADISKE